MDQKLHHTISIIDFRTTEHHTTFVKFKGYDDGLNKNFEGEVKFVRDTPFGDILHPERSCLSVECRQFVRTILLDKYRGCEFN